MNLVKPVKKLERAALAAHRDGVGWADFWQEHGERVRLAEPWNRGTYHRLVNRLLSLVVSGDTDGQQAIGDDAPWEADDQPSPHDTITRAHLLADAIPGVTTADRLTNRAGVGGVNHMCRLDRDRVPSVAHFLAEPNDFFAE